MTEVPATTGSQMTPTQTGMMIGVAGSAITLHAWALLGFPIHDIPEVPAQIEAIATAMVTVEGYAAHKICEFIGALFRARSNRVAALIATIDP